MSYFIRPHPCIAGWAIATDGVAWSGWVWRSRFISPAKTAEPIEMPFGRGLTRVGRRSHVLDGVKVGRIHTPPRGVTSWWCGLLSKFFDDFYYYFGRNWIEKCKTTAKATTKCQSIRPRFTVEHMKCKLVCLAKVYTCSFPSRTCSAIDE